MSDYLDTARDIAAVLKDGLEFLGGLAGWHQATSDSLNDRIDGILGLFEAEVEANKVTTSLLEEEMEARE